VRVERLAESVQILRALLAGEECTFGGRYYQLHGHQLPAPVQKPGIPLLIGGNGPRLHRLAATDADIVGFVGFSHRQGGEAVDLADMSPAALDRQVAQVREAAGERSPELNALVQLVAVTENRHRTAEELAARERVDADTLLTSPYILIGSTDSIIEQLLARRERFGISYWVAFERRGGRELAPVVERLAGTAAGSQNREA
ncbi:MAG: LLM class flavin-dependent oxidoreductase, partial [Candidatus Dormibacteraeota bacterium]|nr:LLM class flavin-dependent oxidoreductase [Candidatus Dormibacteraeota bacterium]